MSELTQQVNQLQNIAQFIAEKLEAQILNGELEPGTRLVQTEVADRFGVSRLPVRDAFALLIKKDLVRALPRKGVQVRQIDVEEVENLFELRELVECYAVGKSVSALSDKDIAAMEKLLAEQKRLGRGNFNKLLEVDERFHRMLWSRCGNKDLDEQLAIIWRRLKLIRAYTRSLKNWKTVSLDNHKRLMTAVKAKKSKDAVEILREGIRRSRSEILECLPSGDEGGDS